MVRLLTNSNRHFSLLGYLVVPSIGDAQEREAKGTMEQKTIDMRRFAIQGVKSITLGSALYRCTEGLFEPSLWGKVCCYWISLWILIGC